MPTPKTVTLATTTLSSTTEPSLRSFAIEAAKEGGVSPYVMVYILQNESNFDCNAIGDHGLARNVAQFHKETFEWMKNKAIKEGQPFQKLTYNSAKDQIILLAWALKDGMGDNWTTYRHYQSLTEIR